CVGHTRALIDPQHMLNYNASAAIEYGALQTKTPWMIAAEAVEGYEPYWENANTRNAAALPWRSISKDGQHQIPEPKSIDPPQPSQLFIEGMAAARDQMMMSSGQYQESVGQPSNAQSGVAINARQRRGDNATFHFIDAQGIAIMTTGILLIDQIPEVYDTERVMRIKGEDGIERNIRISPTAQNAYDESPADQEEDANDILFNPNIGKYAVVADTGPSYATRRQEAFNALTQIIGNDPELKGILGDLLFLS